MRIPVLGASLTVLALLVNSAGAHGLQDEEGELAVDYCQRIAVENCFAWGGVLTMECADQQYNLCARGLGGPEVNYAWAQVIIHPDLRVCSHTNRVTTSSCA